VIPVAVVETILGVTVSCAAGMVVPPATKSATVLVRVHPEWVMTRASLTVMSPSTPVDVESWSTSFGSPMTAVVAEGTVRLSAPS
jgi:hypothetical protein